MSFEELAVVFVIGLLVLGPEQLPRVASQVGRWVGRVRRTADRLRDELAREIGASNVDEPAKREADRRSRPGEAR